MPVQVKPVTKLKPKLLSARCIEWCEKHVKIPSGQHVGKKLKMPKFMVEDFQLIFDNPHGTRTAILSRGRKNAKTTEAALLILLYLAGPLRKASTEIYSTAQAREQASIVFDLADKMIRFSPMLSFYLDPKASSKEIVCRENNSKFRALSADATTAFGLSPRLVIHDELGQVKGPRSPLYEALETAVGAQANPLSIIISTQAATDTDLLSVLIDDALKRKDPRVVVRIDSAPMHLDPFSDEAIRAANPGFDIFQNAQEIRQMARDASAMPSREASYRNLVLNQRVTVLQSFIPRGIWDACGDRPDDLEEANELWCGLDLSAVNDLAAFALCFEKKGNWNFHVESWLPEIGLDERSRLDRTPYDLWAKQGFITLTPGPVIDYEFVARRLMWYEKKYKLKRIAFDRWGFAYLRPFLKLAGFSDKRIDELFVEFGQGFKSMSPALRSIESDVISGRVAHGSNPVLNMAQRNAVITSDSAHNRKLDKARARGRIDPLVAVVMARGCAPLPEPEKEREPEYKIHVLRRRG